MENRKMKMRKQLKRTRPSSIQSLPQDLIVEIVAQLVSKSPAPLSDLDSIRTTCKGFHAASKAKRVGRSIRVDKEHWNLHWWNKNQFFSLLHHLADSGNPQACFILGLEQVYNVGSRKKGLSYLERAKSGGHDAATYLAGILLLGVPERQEVGMEYLREIDDNAERCRSNVMSVMRRMGWRTTETERTNACMNGNPKCGKVNERDWAKRRFCSQRCRWIADSWLINV